MSDNQVSKNDFIREQIKEKPLNKKKLTEKVITAALCGVAFSLTSCGVFALAMPRIQKHQEVVSAGNKEQENPQSPFFNTSGDSTETDSSQGASSEGDSSADGDSSQGSDASKEQDSSKDKGKSEGKNEKPKDVILVPNMELSLEAYQDLQSQLYEIGAEANKSIVTITSVKSDLDWFNNSFETEGQGSGVILGEYNEDILILTEKKLITNAKRMSVTFINGTVAEAALKKFDADTGIALIAVSKTQLGPEDVRGIEAAKLGNSKLMKKGAVVLALGSPLGSNYSILTGNITSTENSISRMDDNYSVFTTDIVGSKNGSGVLVNVDGEVIGIIMQGKNTSEAGNTLTAIGISEVKSVINLLMEGRDIPYLGTSVITVTDQIAMENELPMGVYVKEVAVDSPAMLAGIQSGDVIVRVNDVEVGTVIAYNEQIMKMIPGEEYPVILKRQGANGYYDVRCKVEAGIME